jgi:hypothetical protein
MEAFSMPRGALSDCLGSCLTMLRILNGSP